VRVKGRREPVRIYELRGIGVPGTEEREAIAAFEAGLDAWAQRRFDEAREGLERTLTAWPHDAPSRLYLTALADFAVRPPPQDWDGVITLASK